MSLDAQIAVFCDFGKSEEEQQQAVAALSLLLARKVASIQDLILALGTVLTSADEKLRSRGAVLLAEVTKDLSVVDPVGISSNSASQLAKFFCARLADFPSLLPSLKGLEILVRYHSHRVVPIEDFVRPIGKWPAEHLSLFTTMILNECYVCRAPVQALGQVNVQSLSQSLRSQAFRVYNALLLEGSASRLALGGLQEPVMDYNPLRASDSSAAAAGASFEQEQVVLSVLESILDAVEGEKDPRGLVLSLKLIRAVQTYFPAQVYL